MAFLESQNPDTFLVPEVPEIELSEDSLESQKLTHAKRTLYIKNLNEQVKGEDMEECLNQIFKRYGRVLQVSVKKNVAMKGQAFIVFKSKQSAKDALAGMHDVLFFQKKMNIDWARRDSDIALPEPKRSTKLNRSRLITKEYFQTEKFKKRMAKKMDLRSKQMENPKSNPMPGILDRMLDPNRPPVNPNFMPVVVQQNPMPGNMTMGQRLQQTLNAPHDVLLVEKLPDLTDEEVKGLFKVYDGFKGVRYIQKRRLAFVDFESSVQAGSALNHVKSQAEQQGQVICINFAKK